ncbi:sensor histidine kinase [Sandaracinus amylolyticus]|uniref:sensor histidine kinase n=1 Tax=Sandaracinus amylolyticus TaxID=927083 RepID=UPI0012EED91F|nr:HAMP domain-containing sensor histidine kinase [Sandaracinus amylolyticus]
MTGARGRRSLSERVLTAGVLLFLAPLGFVVASASIEGALARSTEQRVEACARVVAHAWRDGASLAEAAESSCRRHHLRVRVVEGDAVHDVADHLVSTSFDDLVGDVFYGPERSDALRTLERTWAPLPERAETRSAREAGDGMVCTLRADANLRICSGALRATRTSDGARAVVHVIGSSRSARVSRYAQRRELAGMLAFGAVLAFALVAWLLRRVTGTVRDLARDVESLAASRDGRLDEERPRELAEVAAAFNRLRDTLARADAQNEAFLADLAHEMKNPVAAIAAAAESLEAASSADPERRARLSRSITASAARLDRLIGQFLELARAEAGLPRDARERVDLVALAHGVASTTTVPDDRRLVIDAEGVHEVDGVPARLESALRNVIDNAIAFARAEVRVRVVREDATLVLEVHDDGPGIAADDLPRVFDRFYTARQDGRGTGLGLAIVRATVEAHGGTVDVRSRSGEGTTFALRLPAR